jgi:hypothetical protein
MLAAAMSLALAAARPAQEAAPTLTLDDAIRLALRRNKNLKVVVVRAAGSRGRTSSSPAGSSTRRFVAAGTGSDTPDAAEPQRRRSARSPCTTYRTDYYSAGVQGQTPIGTTYQRLRKHHERALFYYGYQNELRDVRRIPGDAARS